MRSRGASLSGALGLQGQARQALEATLCDWRHESAVASTRSARLVVGLRSTLAVLRTLAGVGVAELPQTVRSSFLVRLGLLVLAWVVYQVASGVEPALERFLTVVPFPIALLTFAAGNVSSLVLSSLPMVFLAEVVGPRDRSSPVVGTLLLLGVAATVLVMLVLPVSLTYFRIQMATYFSNASVHVPEVVPTLWSYVHVPAVAAAVGTIWGMFLLANLVRRVGGLTGWAIGLSPLFVFAGLYATVYSTSPLVRGWVSPLIAPLEALAFLVAIAVLVRTVVRSS